MKDKTIQKVAKQVYKNFPEVSGVKPAIHQQNTPQAKSIKATGQTYVLVFKASVSNAKGQAMLRQVRVIANDQGKILRMSTSR